MRTVSVMLKSSAMRFHAVPLMRIFFLIKQLLTPSSISETNFFSDLSKTEANIACTDIHFIQ